MALTDLVKTAGKVLRAAALGLAGYGCGESSERGLCSSYNSNCPRSLPMEYKENIESCDDYFVPENIEKDVDEGDNDRLFLFCIMKTNYCLDLESSDTLQGERDPNVLTCMESFG